MTPEQAAEHILGWPYLPPVMFLAGAIFFALGSWRFFDAAKAREEAADYYEACVAACAETLEQLRKAPRS